MNEDYETDIELIVDELVDGVATPAATDPQSVLELLAMTMFADKQVLASEIKAFVKVVLRFQEQNILSTEFTEATAIKWYEVNKGKLSHIVANHEFENWMDEKISSLEDFPDKHQLLLAMDEIAIADGEKHISEQALEVLTTNKWADALIEKYSRPRAA